VFGGQQCDEVLIVLGGLCLGENSGAKFQGGSA